MTLHKIRRSNNSALYHAEDVINMEFVFGDQKPVEIFKLTVPKLITVLVIDHRIKVISKVKCTRLKFKEIAKRYDTLEPQLDTKTSCCPGETLLICRTAD